MASLEDTPTLEDPAPVTKRGRGRPRGSKVYVSPSSEKAHLLQYRKQTNRLNVNSETGTYNSFERARLVKMRDSILDAGGELESCLLIKEAKEKELHEGKARLEKLKERKLELAMEKVLSLIAY